MKRVHIFTSFSILCNNILHFCQNMSTAILQKPPFFRIIKATEDRRFPSFRIEGVLPMKEQLIAWILSLVLAASGTGCAADPA
ncbi:MAG: hypothetical protein II474_07180, partial [Firmicutes bacterium]|nr:hypothetical protein [Bacillota bacterium]